MKGPEGSGTIKTVVTRGDGSTLAEDETELSDVFNAAEYLDYSCSDSKLIIIKDGVVGGKPGNVVFRFESE